jgi:hypothetical protein
MKVRWRYAPNHWLMGPVAHRAYVSLALRA